MTGAPVASGPVSPRRGLDAYWFWSSLPSEQDMRRQLAGFRAQGFDTIYIQARLSMPRALYLSPDYLDAFAQAVRLMAALGLRAGLYDDYGWGSGHAGGRTVAGADRLRETHLLWAEAIGPEARVSDIRATLGASLGPAARDWRHDGGTPRLADWRLVTAVLLLPDGTMRDVASAARLAEAGDGGATVRLDADRPEGARWVAFVSARIANSTVPNYLLPETGARFVQQGLEPYAQALAGLMPDPLHCLFFDQPAPTLYGWSGQGKQDNLRNSLLWSDGFSEALREIGPLGRVLMALLRGKGESTQAIRTRVYRDYTSMIQRAFFAPVRAFCRRHGLALTGHEILPHVDTFALNGAFPKSTRVPRWRRISSEPTSGATSLPSMPTTSARSSARFWATASQGRRGDGGACASSTSRRSAARPAPPASGK